MQHRYSFLNIILEDFPADPVVRTSLSSAMVWSLVRKLSSHMTQGQKNPTQNIKQKQYCGKFNKDFKNYFSYWGIPTCIFRLQQVLAVTTGIIDLGISTLVPFLFNMVFFFFFFFTPQQNSCMESSWTDCEKTDK